MQTKILRLLSWLTANSAALLLLAGFGIIAGASFSIGLIPGLYTLGGLLVVMAIILFIPGPDERG